MEITEYETEVLKWLHENNPKRFSVHNKEYFSPGFIDMFLWGPMVGSPRNIYNVLCNLYSTNLTDLDNEGYYLTDKGHRKITAIVEKENEERIDKGLNRTKLWYETEIAKKMFDDYPTIKRQAFWALIIAAIAAIATVAQLM